MQQSEIFPSWFSFYWSFDDWIINRPLHDNWGTAPLQGKLIHFAKFLVGRSKCKVNDLNKKIDVTSHFIKMLFFPAKEQYCSYHEEVYTYMYL